MTGALNKRFDLTSSDPKPREGTRTRDRVPAQESQARVVRPKTPRGDENLQALADCRLSVCRQTQNPARGRERGLAPLGRAPLGSRQTQNPARGRELLHCANEKSRRVVRVVRPKTPRGDENRFPLETSGRTRSRRSCRQTQNPARGREHALLLHCANEKSRRVVRTRTFVGERVHPGREVVRPKTPRGDENRRDERAAGPAELGSSDPKPREGTRT